MLDDLLYVRGLVVVLAVVVPVGTVLVSLALESLRRTSPRAARTTTWLLVAVAAVAVGLVTLPPRAQGLRVRHQPILNPWDTLSVVLQRGGWHLPQQFALLNLLLLLPLGALLALNLSARKALLLVIGTSLVIEAAQWWLALGREADAADVLLNVIGGALGVGLALAVQALLPARSAAAAPQATSGA
jgi:hypothetical protein